MKQSVDDVRTTAGLLAIACVIGLALRLPGIGRSLGHDEIYTWVIFASRPLLDIVTSYHLPNNHILHTIALRFSTALFGTSEIAIRLPALIAGVVSFPLLFDLARRMTGSLSVALGATSLLVLTSLHISFSGQARGYTMLVLLCLLHAHGLWRAITQLRADADPPDREWEPWVTAAVSGSLAVLTLPSAAFFVGACAFGTAARIRLELSKARWRRTRVHLFVTVAIVTGVAALIYVPRLDLLYSHAERFGIPLSLTTWPGFVADVWSGIGPRRATLPAALATLVGGILLFVVRRGSGTFLLCVLGLPLLLSLGMSTGGQSRVYLFLLPFVLLSLSFLTIRLHRTLHVALSLRRHISVVLLVALFLPALLVFSGWPSPPPETGYRVAGKWVHEHTQPGDIVVVPYIMDSAIGYYSKGATVGRARDAASTPAQRLLLLSRPGVPRFNPDSLMLATNYTTDGAHHTDTYRSRRWPADWFSEIQLGGATQILQSQQAPSPIDFGDLTDGAAWGVLVESRLNAAHIAVDSTARGPALRLQVGAAEAAALRTNETFCTPTDGLIILSGAVHGQGYVSLFRMTPQGPQAQQMARAISAVPALPDEWRAAIYLLRLHQGDEVGLFLTSIGGTVTMSDLRVFFVPGREP